VQELGGSTANQTAELANGNIPQHRRHARFMNEGWLGGRERLALFIFVSSNHLLSGSSNFSRSLFFWEEFCEILKNS